jgi:hypothetical protein
MSPALFRAELLVTNAGLVMPSMTAPRFSVRDHRESAASKKLLYILIIGGY